MSRVGDERAIEFEAVVVGGKVVEAGFFLEDIFVADVAVVEVEGARMLAALVVGERVVEAFSVGASEEEPGVAGFGVELTSMLGASKIGDRIFGTSVDGAGVKRSRCGGGW